MSGALSGSADPNIGRGAPPPSEHYIYPGEQGGNNVRAELNIGTQSSIDQSISAGFALGGKQYGREETKGPPILQQPLWNLRTSLSTDAGNDETAWQEERNSLAESLPKQLLNDPAFSDFLTTVAMTVEWLKEVGAPYHPNGPELNNIFTSSQVIQGAILNTLTQAGTILHEGELFLKSVGAGYAEFDTLSRLLGDIKTIFDKLSSLTRRYEEHSLNDDDKALLKRLINQLQAILMSMDTTAATSRLLILGPTVGNLILTATLLLQKQGEQLTEMTKALSTIGFNNGENALLGPQLNTLATAFATQMQRLSPAGTATINPQLLTVALGILLSAAAYTMQVEQEPRKGGV